MKFFIPGAQSDQEGEQVYQATIAHVQTHTRSVITKRRIYDLEYFHNGKHMEATVGEEWGNEGPVIAILESKAGDLFYVCTLERGVARGLPILVGNDEVRSVSDFA